MALKKSMKEWGVSNELELIREIIQSSPYLKLQVNQKMRVLKETASENMFQVAAKTAERNAAKAESENKKRKEEESE